MDLSAEQQGDVTVVSIVGSVDALTAGEVMSYFERQVSEGATRLVADLRAVDYVSSAGLRSFLATLKAARQAGGDLRLAGAQDNVHKVLAMAGFTSILKTYPNVETAVNSFA
ncbi:MAG TPA: STAS domain-containing protein [Chloroflexia bacterium]|nr:STAS domain-containing protein [Chloroflexia bacterium]